MRIVIDLTNSTDEERKHLIGFIATYPPALQEFTAEQPKLSLPPSPGKIELVSMPTLAEEDLDDDTQSEDVEVKGEPLPWDERIHSGNKTKNENGSYRYKKGVSKELVATVEAELRAIPPTLSRPPAEVAPVVDVAPVSDAPTADKAGFITLLKFSTQLQKDKKLTLDEINDILLMTTGGEVDKQANLGGANLHFVPAVWTALKEASSK